MKITLNKLKQTLARETGSKTTIVEFAAKTVPPMRVKNNPYLGRVTKVAKVNAIIGIWAYANSINRQRLREEKKADFESLERCWGHRIPYSPFVEYNGKLYLEAKVQRAESALYLDDKLVTTNELEILERFLITKKGESKRQKVDKEIVLRDYELKNITHLQLQGKLFEVV